MRFVSRGKLLKITLAIGVLGLASAGAAYLYHRHHMSQLYARFKTDGLAASKEGNDVLAVEDLHYFLLRYNDDQEALRAYVVSRPRVEANGRRNALIDAVYALRHLIELESDATADRRTLLEMYLELGADSETVNAADDILSRTPNDLESLSAKTGALRRLGKLSDALVVANHWAEVAPTDMTAKMMVLAIRHEMRVPIAELVDQAAKFRSAHGGDPRGDFLVGFALNLKDNSSDALHLDRSTPMFEGKTAADWLRSAADHTGPDVDFCRLLVNQFNAMMLFDDSLNLLRRIDQSSVCPPIQRDLVRRFWESRAWPQIVGSVEKSNKTTVPDNSETLGIYAVALKQTNRAADSQKIRDALAARKDDPLAMAWLAVIDEQSPPTRDDLQHIVTACTTALRADGTDATLQYLRGEAFAWQGNTLTALAAMHNAASCSATWTPLTTAADMELGRGEIDAALTAASEALRRSQATSAFADLSVPAMAARVMFVAQTKGRAVDRDALKRLVDSVQQASPGELSTLEIQLSLLKQFGRADEAKAAPRAAIESQNPMSEGALIHLAHLSDSLDLDCAGLALERSEKEHGLTPAIASAEAQSLLQSGKVSEGRDLLESDRKKSASANSSLWQIVECSYLEASKDPNAARSWIELADRLPDDLNVQRAALASKAAAADRAFTERAIARIKTLAGENSTEWRLMRASWLMAKADKSSPSLHEAGDLVTSVLHDDPSSAQAHSLDGHILELQNDIPGAIGHFRTASDLNPINADAALELVHLVKSHDDATDLRERVQKVVDGPAPNAEACSVLGWLQQKDGLLLDAEHSYRRALVLEPNLPVAQNNLAMVLLSAGGPAKAHEAVQLATAATSTQSDNASYFDTLAEAQQRAGNSDQAVRALERSIQLSPANLGLRVKRAEWLVAAGRRDEALASLAEIKHIQPDLSLLDSDLRQRVEAMNNSLAQGR